MIPQSFSFQIVSNTFVKFSDFMSRGRAFDSLFLSPGRVVVQSDCPRGGFPLRVVSRGSVQGGWLRMKLIAAFLDAAAARELYYLRIGIPTIASKEQHHAGFPETKICCQLFKNMPNRVCSVASTNILASVSFWPLLIIELVVRSVPARLIIL